MLLRLEALDPTLGLLLLQDDEGPSIFIEDHGHLCGGRPLRDGFLFTGCLIAAATASDAA